jgi:transposase
MAKHEQSVVAVTPKSGQRRSFSKAFKRELVEQTLRAGVSVAGVALANGINTNLLARWRRHHLIAQAGTKAPALIPVHVVEHQPAQAPVPARAAAVTNGGEIEIRCSDATVLIRGVPDAATLGTVLRALLHAGHGLPK